MSDAGRERQRECAQLLTGLCFMAHPLAIAANSAIGRENPTRHRRNSALVALFCCLSLQFYGGRVGQALAWPGSYVPGFSPRHVRRQVNARLWWRILSIQGDLL